MLDFAPRVIAGRIDDAFDLSSQKKSQIKESINQELQENRKYFATQLIDIFRLIQKKILIEEPQQNSLIEIFNLIASFEREALLKFKNSVRITFSHLSQKEIEHFRDFQFKKLTEESDDISSSEKLLRKVYERYESFFEFFLDSLNAAQRAEIESFIKAHEAYYRNQIVQRKVYAEKFSSQGLSGLSLNSPQLRPPNHGPSLDGNLSDGTRPDLEQIFFTQFSIPEFDLLSPPDKKQFVTESMNLVLKVWSLSTPSQKKQMQKELDRHMESLQEILKGS